MDEELAHLDEADAGRATSALALFDWTQRAADLWRGSNAEVRREILDAICLNRILGDVNLYTEKRKPFDAFAERPDLKTSRDDRI